MTTTLGDTIRKLRRNQALTQEDLAARSGLAVATIQRAERDTAVSADTVASIAAALGVDASTLMPTEPYPDDQPYLPIAPITSGRALIAMLTSASRLDFGFAELENLDQAAEVEALHAFCMRIIGNSEPATPILTTTRELEAKALLARFERSGFVVSGGGFDITAYEIDDDGGAGTPICFGQWDECCAVLRVGVGEPIARAYVLDSLGKYETPKGDAVIFPPRDVANEWNEFFGSLPSPKEG